MTFRSTLKAGIFYFAVVFSVGFVLGTIRVLWVVPSFGVRQAEFMEGPIMVIVSAIAANWIARSMRLPATVAVRLGMGGLGLALTAAAEFTLAL